MNVISAGKLEVGMFVTVLEDISEETWKDSNPQSPMVGLIGIPFEVKAICLPFIMGTVQRPQTMQMILMGGGTAVVPIDTRKVRLMEVTEEFYNIFAGHAPKKDKVPA